MPEERAPGWEQRLLERSAAELAYPPAPALASAVLARITAGPERTPLRARPIALAIGAVVALLLGLSGWLLVSRDLREAVADFLGLAVENERITILPPPPAGTTVTPFPTPQRPGAFATPVSAAAAAAALPAGVFLPPGHGEPRAYYLVRYLEQLVLILEYETFDLWEAGPAVFEKGFVFSKGVTILEELTVGGRPAYWLDGGGHIVRVLDSEGKEVAGSVRTVEGKTLVWRGAERNYRLETLALTKEQALAIAETLP